MTLPSCPNHVALATEIEAVVEEFAARLAGLPVPARLAVCSSLSFRVMYEIAMNDAQFDGFVDAMGRRLRYSMNVKRRELAEAGGTPS